MSGRVTQLIEAVAVALRELPHHDVRTQMDPLDLDLVEIESFRDTALRVVFASARPQFRPTGDLDLGVAFGVFILTTREGRADPDRASADARAMDLALSVVGRLNADPYVGLAKLATIRADDLRVYASEKSNNKGIAIVGVSFETTLYDVAIPHPSFVAGAESGAASWRPDQYQIGDGAPVDIVYPEPTP